MAPASLAADYIIIIAFQNIHADFLKTLIFFSLYILLQVCKDGQNSFVFHGKVHCYKRKKGRKTAVFILSKTFDFPH